MNEMDRQIKILSSLNENSTLPSMEELEIKEFRYKQVLGELETFGYIKQDSNWDVFKRRIRITSEGLLYLKQLTK